MQQQYRLFRRAGVYYVHDNHSGKQESLRTRNRDEARRLFHAKNEAYRQPQVNLQIARAYLAAGDPALLKRTWQNVMDAAGSTKRGVTLRRWQSAMREKPFDLIRELPVLETRAEHLLAMLAKGTLSTNVYLRRVHNFALDMTWLPCQAPIGADHVTTRQAYAQVEANALRTGKPSAFTAAILHRYDLDRLATSHLIYFSIVFAPWAFGTTGVWSISVMNATG